MTRQRLNEHWNAFATAYVPLGTMPEVRSLLRVVFYAGAGAATALILEAAAGDELGPTVHALMDELLPPQKTPPPESTAGEWKERKG